MMELIQLLLFIIINTALLFVLVYFKRLINLQEETNKLLQKLYDEKTLKSSDNKKTAMPSDELEKLKASYMRKSFKYD
tara:strand:+ start:99 stop:332 length:234 start_codon:yes stop_codon:yes gene_type:complete